MKSVVFLMSWCALMTAVAAQQTKKAPAPVAATSPAAKICDDPYQIREPAEGWPEAPVYILFHREKSKTPWARNPAIHIAGVEAASAAGARTLVCVEESQIEMGKYDTGEPAYTPSWNVILVRLADRKVYFMRGGFYGKEPPGIKYHRGAGVGAPPIKIFADWLPLVVNQKVARLKTRLRPKEYHEASALAFSADSSKLVLAQAPRSTLDGTPPSPVTVFDLATGNILASWHIPYLVGGPAISPSGTMVAVPHAGHPEVWDVASVKVLHKLDASAADSLLFGPDDVLSAVGGGKATLWDVKNERVIASATSAKGSSMMLSPAGDWLAVNADPKGLTVQAIQSGNTLATFHGIGDQDKYAISGDLKSMAWQHGLSITMVAAGASEEHSVSLPGPGVSILWAFAPARDGFVFGNGDGIVGLASVSSPEPRVFATDQSSIRVLAVSPDGKLLAVGDSSGVVTIWELR
jgi:hypothetical protein